MNGWIRRWACVALLLGTTTQVAALESVDAYARNHESPGRFMTVDPVTAEANGDWRHFNRYAYAYNSPYRHVDPDGRDGLAFYTQPQFRMPAPPPQTAGPVLDLLPGVGDVRGIYQAYQQPTLPNVAGAVIGLIPVVGDVGGKLLKNAGSVADVAKAAPNFVVTPGGTAFPVPTGATGPVPSINPAGNVTGAKFEGGSGGANGQVASMRIMDPNPSNPTGYIKYENNASPTPQGVDPYTGRTVSPDKAHFPIDKAP